MIKLFLVDWLTSYLDLYNKTNQFSNKGTKNRKLYSFKIWKSECFAWWKSRVGVYRTNDTSTKINFTWKWFEQKVNSNICICIRTADTKSFLFCLSWQWSYFPVWGQCWDTRRFVWVSGSPNATWGSKSISYLSLYYFVSYVLNINKSF